MNIIVYGIGGMGEKIIPFLEEEHHILFLTDSDEKKWGTVFGSYRVEPPGELKKHDCAIAVTSTKYGAEIAEQLQEMGIGKSRIYLCRRFQAEDTYSYEIYPLLAELLPDTEVPLIRYDLLHAEEEATGRKKVLVACSAFSVYTKQLIENMAVRYRDIEFGLLTNARESEEKIASEHLRHIYYFRRMADLKAILGQLPMYDAMQLLWIEQEWSYFWKVIREKTKRLNLNVGGSDFYRAAECQRNFNKNIIACADCITAETRGTVRDFEAYYGDVLKHPLGLLPFGIEVLELIQKCENTTQEEIKSRFRIPNGRIVVTCGHNANTAHQHMEIIEALQQLPEERKEQIVCVFPMTYPQGTESYVKAVREKLGQSGLTFVVLTEFMDFGGMAAYASISDIMIHVQTTDQLSSTMLEEMYAGSLVIAGSWLPYESLHEMGIYFLDVGEMAELADVLEDAIIHLDVYREKCAGNRDIVWRHSSWDALAPRWHALWENTK